MKRLLVVLSLALLSLVVLGAGVAYATHSGGQGPKKDKANGTGQVEATDLDQQIHVNAHGKPSKQARGYIVEKTTTATDEIRYKARVTCINAVGDDAVVGGQIERVKAGTVTPGEFVLLFIHDGEEPGANADQISRVFTGTTEPTCTETATGLTPITQGNYVVHDGA